MSKVLPVSKRTKVTNLKRAGTKVAYKPVRPANKKHAMQSSGAMLPPKLINARIADNLDRTIHARIGRYTAGLSPVGLGMAYYDWLVHLSMAPGRRARLIDKALRKTARLNSYMTKCLSAGDVEPCINPLPQDRRFQHEGWQKWPFNLFYQSFLLNQQWWHNATNDVRGVSKKNQDIVSFSARQILDVFSPSNFIFTNPEVLQATVKEAGHNLVRGGQYFIEDWERAVSGKAPVGCEEFQVGINIASTPGKVVYQNDLIELIQFTARKRKVHAEPILIVPAWIMKYYILDLSRHNSMVKYLVDHGHTVFMISWKNPTADDCDLGIEDYRQLGVMAALDAVTAIVPRRKVHCVGYCLGGTLLSIAAAAMARYSDERIKSLTLLAAQTDFTEAGELMLFINQSQLTLLEDIMWDQGYLDTQQMSGAFQILRSNDLIWSRLVHDYLLGQRQPMIDLMAWNADATRMPFRMHSEYLQRLFLNNDLASGRYNVDGHPIALSDLRTPIFCVGATRDHVAPWKSAYKIHLLADAQEITFLLASGGHNAGIVSEPGHPHRSYQIATQRHGQRYIDPDTWVVTTPRQEGSWWPAWHAWLVEHSNSQVSPPAVGAPSKGYPIICDAPGTYVMQT